MKKILGLLRRASRNSLMIEYLGVGVIISLFSLFFGFYTAAAVTAERCYPELSIATIESVHRLLFHSLPRTAALYTLALLVFYWFFADRQFKKIARDALETGEKE